MLKPVKKVQKLCLEYRKKREAGAKNFIWEKTIVDQRQRGVLDTNAATSNFKTIKTERFRLVIPWVSAKAIKRPTSHTKLDDSSMRELNLNSKSS
jgi:uncharacterized protein YegL